MESYIDLSHYDLISPDGYLTYIKQIEESSYEAHVRIEGISNSFVGFELEPDSQINFNVKSTLAQLGLHAVSLCIDLDKKHKVAEIELLITAIDPLAKELLKHLKKGAYIGKLFAADDRRLVRHPHYLNRLFGRSDHWGDPLLSLGGLQGSQDLILEEVDGRAIAYLSLQKGVVQYDSTITGLFPTICNALKKKISTRKLLSLHQKLTPGLSRKVTPGKILLVRTPPLHVRTVFGRVVNELLPKNCYHTSADLLEPTTQASGDIYELFGNNPYEITDIPIEFYTLEPHREHVFFADRDQLQTSLEKPESLFKAFSTAPEPKESKAAVFIVKGTQLQDLTPEQWISRTPQQYDLPGISQDARQSFLVQRYIENQPSYPFWKAIEDGLITSQGILLTRYFPSPLMKRMLLAYHVHRQLKGIYFQYPSLSNEQYFSQEDRALLNDLHKFGIPVYWVDETSHNILQYIQKQGKDSGLFVPKKLRKEYLNATVFGVYGSNLVEGEFEENLYNLMKGLQLLKKTCRHPKLNPETPLALLTGGGPGAMALANRTAHDLGILSCANIVDFRKKNPDTIVNEQRQNPYIQAKMTYTLDKIVERQAEFQLDFPLFLCGGIGTDFEYSLEEVRRKVGSTAPTPILLCGPAKYWKEKITERFECNLKYGTIKGSEWLSNCFYSIENAKEGLDIYRRYFTKTLPIGPKGPTYKEGFCIYSKYF
jgi:predicted Rossmann-fold nucleotide-binding protein